MHLPGELWHSGQKHNQGKTQPEEYEVFTTEYEYDTFGRLQNMLFPDGERLTYSYNAGGVPSACPPHLPQFKSAIFSPISPLPM